MTAFSDLHMEHWRSERPSPKSILKALSRGWDKRSDASYSSNTLGFEYFSDADEVGVFAASGDGSDELRYPRETFCAILRDIKTGELR